MDRKAFHSLLKKYLDRKCTQEEKIIIDRWYDLLDEPNVPMAASADVQLGTLEDRLWNKIHREIDETAPEEKSRIRALPSFVRWKWAAAVLIVFVVGAGLLLLSRRQAAKVSMGEGMSGSLAEKVNQGESPQVILLEDGTRVTLRHGGKVDYPEHFGKNKREVHLEGEAFFEVSKDLRRPFFVYNENLVTEVLGTSFNVKAVTSGVEVAVSTGKVAVYENGNKISLSPREKLENGVIITANQKVTYYEQARHFVTSIVDTPLPVPPVADKKDSISFVYDDMPLSTVLASIEKTYNIEIVLENDSLKNCPFTGDLTKPSLYNKLEFICQALGASYEIKGTKILLKGGKSCN